MLVAIDSGFKVPLHHSCLRRVKKLKDTGDVTSVSSSEKLGGDLQVSHVSKTFRGRIEKALDDITFNVQPGSVYALLG